LTGYVHCNNGAKLVVRLESGADRLAIVEINACAELIGSDCRAVRVLYAHIGKPCRDSIGIDDSINAVYNYRNSVMGVLDVVQSDYNNMNLDAQAVQTSIADPNNLTLLKDVMTKLG
jgi:hypothetical protein